MGERFQSPVLNAYRPTLVPVSANLTAAVFPLMKIFPAEFCLLQAIQYGIVDSHSTVVETSSGNMALGLAIACNLRRLKLTIVTDYACDAALKRRLEDLGATVEIVPAPAAVGGYQRSRLDRLNEIRSQTRNHWWLRQYENPGNPGAYSGFASQLIESLGRVDCLVGSVGSGGSVCGTARYLRELFPEMTVVGVDTFSSVLFGLEDGPRQLRGLGNSLLPANLDHSTFDEVHWVTAAEAYMATRRLHRQTSLFCGGTSGAAWLAASCWASRNRKAKTVFICPDDGYRYMDTIYSDDYLIRHGLYLSEPPGTPREVQHPRDAGPSWSHFNWGRRTRGEVMEAGATACSSEARR
jgi:S-sulfo-L-cysteine synthase (3-phospho-L-serine-dependent)